MTLQYLTKKKKNFFYIAFTVHYKFPKLFSDREMAIWVLAIQPDPTIEQFLVISLPATHPVSSHVTRAVYCAIEVVTYKEEENHVEWIMAQTSDARGSIPRWIQDRSVTATVASDVPSFITWANSQIKNRKQEPSSATTKLESPSTNEVIDSAIEKTGSMSTEHVTAASPPSTNNPGGTHTTTNAL